MNRNIGCGSCTENAYVVWDPENNNHDYVFTGRYCPCDAFRHVDILPSHLLDCMDRNLLVKLAECENAEPALLDKLAESQWVQVRLAVADNARTLIFSLLKLAYDVDDDVRYRMAENPKMPLQVLQVLQKDENPFVSYRADLTVCKLGQ